jgi:benzoate-CoA ligase
MQVKAMELSHADHAVQPPQVTVPRHYNAAHDLLARNRSHPDKAAYLLGTDGPALTYGDLDQRVRQFAGALRQAGLKPEDRVMLCMLDGLNWPVAFLGCIYAGVVPIATNTLLTPADYRYMLEDSRAVALLVSSALWPQFENLDLEGLSWCWVDGDAPGSMPRLEDQIQQAQALTEPHPTVSDEACFWLYSSGSTGAPKGTVHLHSHLIQTAELYGRGVLGIRSDDLVFSAAKLFFAYGLGNALSFPLAVGATTVLLPSRPTPDDVFAVLKARQPTIFYGVPTLFAALLASPNLPAADALALRVSTSAGEALPADIGQRWRAHFGSDILDGIGSTEMLHIFLSNRHGEVRYGTTGKPVPGYEVQLIGDDGLPVAQGELGELQIRGPSAALMYWNNREKTKHTFAGEWTRSGDKYSMDTEGYYTYGGRSDDMLKVGGIYVSPFEVEASLMTHPAVLEAAVVGQADEADLIKPKAYVVLKPGQSVSAADLQQHVKAQLAPYKYPRWIEFVPDLPKTATGKIQRFKLRSTTP